MKRNVELIALALALMAGSVACAAQSPDTPLTTLVAECENNDAKQTDGTERARFAMQLVTAGLARSGRFVILTSEEIERAATELRLRPPYDLSALQRIGGMRIAGAIVRGKIVAVTSDKKE